MSKPTLAERLTALDTAAELADGRIARADSERIRAVAQSGSSRRELSDEHTVVGFFGATGSGKSSLFNAIVGADVATTHVRRPTTSTPLAAVWQPDGSAALLDWLEVRDRSERTGGFDKQVGPLILLDLPDFDSVRSEHRDITARLAAQVDVLVWVVDPEKYADAVIHRDFITPHSGHSAVTLAVLNKTDLLSASDQKAVADSFRDLLERDGLGKVKVLGASARTGDGVDAVRQQIAKVAKGRRAQLERIEADIDSATSEWAGARVPSQPPRDAEKALTQALGQAAGVPAIAAAVGSSYRKRLGQRTGWLLTSWMLRFRADPLRRLGLREEADESGVHRSSMPKMSASGRAQANKGVRDYAARASADLSGGWAESVRERAESALPGLPEELDRAVARTRLQARVSWGWSIVTVLQWVALLAALVGVGWYLLLWLMGSFGFGLPFLTPEVPTVEGWQVPTLLVAGGILLGILLGLLSAAFGGVAGAVRRTRARRRLLRQVNATAREEIVEPVREERERWRGFVEAVKLARRR